MSTQGDFFPEEKLQMESVRNASQEDRPPMPHEPHPPQPGNNWALFDSQEDEPD